MSDKPYGPWRTFGPGSPTPRIMVRPDKYFLLFLALAILIGMVVVPILVTI